jgi:hypothetical protein
MDLPILHCLNVHLGLFERGRQWQIQALVDRINERVPKDAPMVIAGDFNDWRRKGDSTLTDLLGVYEVFEEVKGRHARTFPSLMPVFPPGSHLRARAGRRRRARALCVSLRPSVGSRRSGGDIRGSAQTKKIEWAGPCDPAYSDDPLHPRQRDRPVA